MQHPDLALTLSYLSRRICESTVFHRRLSAPAPFRYVSLRYITPCMQLVGYGMADNAHLTEYQLFYLHVLGIGADPTQSCMPSKVHVYAYSFPRCPSLPSPSRSPKYLSKLALPCSVFPTAATSRRSFEDSAHSRCCPPRKIPHLAAAVLLEHSEQ